MEHRTKIFRRAAAAVALCAAVVVAAAVPANAYVAPYTPTFPDVPTTHLFYVEIEWLVAAGVTTGYDDGNFRPVTNTSRQVLAAFLYRYAEGGQAPLCTVQPFTDVTIDNAFCGEIAWGKEMGLIQGYPDGTFRPTNTITRQAAVAYLYRLDDSPNGPDPTCTSAPFTDIPTSHEFCGEIQWAKDNDIVSGFDDGTFGPTNPVTRQAFASFLFHFDTYIDGTSVSALGAVSAAGAAGAAATTGGSQTPATGTDGASETASATPTAVATGGSDGASLPVTGGNVGSVAVLGILLMGGGALLVVGTRRRRQGIAPTAS